MRISSHGLPIISSLALRLALHLTKHNAYKAQFHSYLNFWHKMKVSGQVPALADLVQRKALPEIAQSVE